MKATQTIYPWRTVSRTVFQAIIGLAAVMPLIINASGVDETLPVIVLMLAISGGVTRIMALEEVETWLQTNFPWLAAEPKQAE